MRHHRAIRLAQLALSLSVLWAFTPVSASAQAREDWAAVMALSAVLLAQSNKAEWAMFMGAGWGAVGAAIGATNGLSRAETVIYQKPRSPTTNTHPVP